MFAAFLNISISYISRLQEILLKETETEKLSVNIPGRNNSELHCHRALVIAGQGGPQTVPYRSD